MVLTLTKNERAFAEDALDAMHDVIYRPWRPEPAERYSELAKLMSQRSTDLVELDAVDASHIMLAVKSYDGKGFARDILVNQLIKAFDFPRNALSLKALSSLDSRPVFIPAMKAWALVHLVHESREHNPLPMLKGVNFELDPLARGTLCVKTNPYD